MAEPHVISALREKHAELEGELRQAEKRVIQLRADLEAIDGALRVFDPSLAPHTIRPKARRKPPSYFRYGQFARTVLDTLRRASAPMSARSIAETIVRDFRLDVQTTDAMNMIVGKVRNALARHGGNLEHSRDGDVRLWKVRDA